MPSTSIRKRPTANGGMRYRVEYRVGGREGRARYAGSFRTQREAPARKAWVAGELAHMRVPDLELLTNPVACPTLRDVAERWRASQVSVRG